MKSEALRVVIADDHPVFRAGLRQVIESVTGFCIVGEAGDGEQALELAEQLRPELLILDANMPRLTGFEVADRLLGRNLGIRVVMLSMLNDEQSLNRALNAGVEGYVIKEDAASDLHSCLQRVTAGQAYVSPSLTGFLLRRRSRADQLAGEREGLDSLTTAERRILKRVAQKKSTKEIARELFVSPRTVEAHRLSIRRKLGVESASEFLKLAVAQGWTHL